MAENTYRQAAEKSRLMDLPAGADQRKANLIIQKNFETIWRTLMDIKDRIDKL